MAEVKPIQELSDLDLAALNYGQSLATIQTPKVFLDRLTELYSPSAEGSSLSLDDTLNEDRFSLGTGARSNAIRNIVSPGGKYNPKLIQELTRDYDSGAGVFKTKIGPIARLAGVTDDDVVKAIGGLIEQQRNDNPLVRKADQVLRSTGREGVKQTTSAEQIRDVVTTESKRGKLLEDIGGTVKGGAFLKAFRDKYGDRLTNPQLRQVLAQAQSQDPDAVAERKNLEQQTESLENADQNASDRLKLDTQTAADTTRIQDDQLDINRVQVGNELALAQERIALERAQLTGQNTRQQQLLDHQTAVANKNTDLQLALAEMNRGDRQDDRAYDRERDERDRRQALMVMLMQGLGNLGRGFGSSL